MDGLRVARGKLVFLADWSDAGMYTAFDCGVFMPLALMSSADRIPGKVNALSSGTH